MRFSIISAILLAITATASPLLKREDTTEVAESFPVPNSAAEVSILNQDLGLDKRGCKTIYKRVEKFISAHSPHAELSFDYVKAKEGTTKSKKLTWYFAFSKDVHFNVISIKFHHDNQWVNIPNDGKFKLGFHFIWEADNWVQFSKKPIDFSINYEKYGEIFYSTNCAGKPKCLDIAVPKEEPIADSCTLEKREQESSVFESFPEPNDSAEVQVLQQDAGLDKRLPGRNSSSCSTLVKAGHFISSLAPNATIAFDYVKLHNSTSGSKRLTWYFGFNKDIKFNIIAVKFHHKNTWTDVFNISKWRLGFHFVWEADNWVEFSKKPIDFSITYEKYGEFFYSTGCGGRPNCFEITVPESEPAATAESCALK